MENAISMVECSRGSSGPDMVQPAIMKCCAQDPIRHTCCLGLALTADIHTSSHYHNPFRENPFVSVASYWSYDQSSGGVPSILLHTHSAQQGARHRGSAIYASHGQ